MTAGRDFRSPCLWSLSLRSAFAESVRTRYGQQFPYPPLKDVKDEVLISPCEVNKSIQRGWSRLTARGPADHCYAMVGNSRVS
ncbi:hypothetical protein BDV11DRAFT_56552 [Aspergillus similis]